MRTPFAAVASLGAALVLSGCGAGADSSSDGAQVTVTHAQGESKVPANPERVVVLDYGVLDSMAALDVESNVVGLPKQALPASLESYAADQFADVGSLKEPDMEKIAEINPDLIVIGGRSAAMYDEFTEIAPTIDLTVDSDDFLGGLQSSTQAVAKVFAKQSEVSEEIAEVEEKVASAKTEADQAGKALIVLISGGKMSAYGPGSRFGFVHDVVGVEAASPDLKVDAHGQAISFEFLAKTNPDTLYVIDRDAAIGQSEAGQSAKEVLDNDLVAGTKAAKNDRIVYLDGARWYLIGAGLDNVDEMVDEVASAYRS